MESAKRTRKSFTLIGLCDKPIEMGRGVLTVTDLSTRWEMDEETIYEMARRRILVALQHDGCTYISLAHVERLENQGMTDLSREDLIE
jgi:hypothetical protein